MVCGDKNVKIKIKCIHHEGEEMLKIGYQKNGTPRCECKDCEKTFKVYYLNYGTKPETKK